MRSLVVASGLLALMSAAPAMAQAAYTIEPFTPQQQITIQGTGVRLRAEPSTAAPMLNSGSTGLPLAVIGIARLPDWNWYQVTLKSGQTAYIRSDLTSAPSRGGLAAVPEYGAPAGSRAAPIPVRQLPPAPVPPPYDPSKPLTPAPSLQSSTPPAPVQATAPRQGGGAISLIPPPPSANTDGLQSRPPGQ